MLEAVGIGQRVYQSTDPSAPDPSVPDPSVPDPSVPVMGPPDLVYEARWVDGRTLPPPGDVLVGADQYQRRAVEGGGLRVVGSNQFERYALVGSRFGEPFCGSLAGAEYEQRKPVPESVEQRGTSSDLEMRCPVPAFSGRLIAGTVIDWRHTVVLGDHRGSVATQLTPRIASSIANADPAAPPIIRTSVAAPGDDKRCLLVVISPRY